MKYLIPILLIMLSCNVPKKVQQGISDYKKSSDFPQDCADKFPIKRDTFFIAGKQVTDTVLSHRIDYIYTDTGSIRTITQVKTITQRTRDTVVVTKVDGRQIAALQRLVIENSNSSLIEITNLKTALEKSEAKRKKTGSTNRWLIFVIIGVGLWQFRHSLITLITKQ